MKFVIQRVERAEVTSGGETLGAIGLGLAVLIGVGKDDDRETADKLIKKLVNMRIFEDEDGKTNKSLADVDGELLLVSQFTLYADCKRGNRPSFINAGAPDVAEELYNYIIEQCKNSCPKVQTGAFGADMRVSLVNQGPFTVILDSMEL